MSWHYRIRKRIINGSSWFDVVEYYTGPMSGWTKDGMAPGGETRADAIRELEMMLADVKKYKTLVDKEEP